MLKGVIFSLFAVGFIYSLLAMMSRDTTIQRTVQLHLAAQTIRNNLETHLRNNEAWNFTMADPANVSFNCFDNSDECLSTIGSSTTTPPLGDPPPGVPVVQLRNTADQVVIGNGPNQGFTLSGEICNTYSDTAPDPQCPFQVQINWEPVCTAPCPTPAVVRLHTRLHYKVPERNKVPFNPLNYQMTVERPSLR